MDFTNQQKFKKLISAKPNYEAMYFSKVVVNKQFFYFFQGKPLGFQIRLLFNMLFHVFLKHFIYKCKCKFRDLFSLVRLK